MLYHYIIPVHLNIETLTNLALVAGLRLAAGLGAYLGLAAFLRVGFDFKCVNVYLHSYNYMSLAGGYVISLYHTRLYMLYNIYIYYYIILLYML